MRLVLQAVVILALAAGLRSPSPLRAQSDTRGLIDRLDRLERDLNTLQSQVYRGQTSGAAAGGGGGGGAGLSGDAYGRLDDRISSLETQLHELTGAVEKANFANGQLQSKLDRMQADNDFRFKALETKTGLATAPAATPSASATPPAAGADTGPTALAPAAGVLSHPATPGGAAPPPPPPAAAKSPQEQYDRAFAMLRNSDYDGAGKAFQGFIAQYPQDPLAGNAMYWLGQIPYSQGQFEQAAVIFLDAYRKYPKSAKAGESLLKVGLAMSNLNKNKEACAALHRFTTEYPDAADNLKRQAAVEKKKLGC